MIDSNELIRLFMLALCVYREARGESELGKLLVAQTVINRATDTKQRWPRSIVGVITQRLQFSSFNKSDPNVTVYPAEGDAAWAQCVAAAEKALTADTPVTLANHYHSTAIKPRWADSTKITETEGNHIFYRL